MHYSPLSPWILRLYEKMRVIQVSRLEETLARSIETQSIIGGHGHAKPQCDRSAGAQRESADGIMVDVGVETKPCGVAKPKHACKPQREFAWGQQVWCQPKR